MIKMSMSRDATAWAEIEDALLRGAAHASQFNGIKFLIGSNLPYASHWIESGWRNDPRIGRVTVTYRSPAATNFMANALRRVVGKRHGIGMRLRRPSESIFGVGFVSVAFMADYGEDIVLEMQDNLTKSIYSRGTTGINTKTGRTWERTHALFNSIQARRV